MKVWSALFNLVTVVCIIILAAAYMNIDYVLERDFDQLRYDYAVRQATEAMFRSTLNAEDIGLDYSDLSYVTIDCANALDIFDRVICANYNMAPSEINFNAINENFVTCVIAGYDGFYILQSSESDSMVNGVAYDSTEARFSSKIPYLITRNNNTYALDSYKKQYTSMPVGDHKANPTLYTTQTQYPPDIDKALIETEINNQIRTEILKEARNSSNVSLAAFDSFRLFFPESKTVTGVNPFEVPGVFVMLEGANYASTDELTSIRASGFKVVRERNVVVFRDTSVTPHRSYYCYEGQLRDDEKTQSSGGLPVSGEYGMFEIIDYYATIQEACSAVNPNTGDHYSPYYDIMARKVVRQETTDDTGK